MESDMRIVNSHSIKQNSMTLDDATVNINNDSIDVPIIVYIIICFICVITIVAYRSSMYSIPSVMTMTTVSMIMLTSCAVLLLVGTISVVVEWGCLVLLTTLLLMCTFTILYPDVLFYPTQS